MRIKNKITRMVAAAAITAGCCVVSGCCNGACPSDAGGKDAISQLVVEETLLSASKSYKVNVEGMDAWLTFTTSVDWPEKIGDCELATLRDTLLQRMYKVQPGTDVRKAMRGFINDRGVFGRSATFTEVDSVPATPESYEVTCTGKLLSLSERMVTYQVYSESYMGGAHPMHATYPFTYDLVNGEVVSLRNLFKPGSDPAVLALIKEQLATQEGVAVDKLGEAGILVDRLNVSPLVYLRQGEVVFHYVPYSVAPYSKGEIDVAVPSFQLRDYLTGQAAELLK